MEYISQIEEQIDDFIEKNQLTSAKGVFIVLNRTYITKYSKTGINSVCLHLSNKYSGMQWPKLCVEDSYTIVLFIGLVE